MPGVVFLEIDGLAHDVLRRALRDGNAPVLARWMHDGGYRLERWETDWSSQTGACQAGLLHGNDDDMPAFRWWEKDTGARSSPTTRATRPRSSAAAPTAAACSTPTARAARTSSPATRRTAC